MQLFVIFSFLNSASARDTVYPHVDGSADGWDCMEGHTSGLPDFAKSKLTRFPCQDAPCSPEDDHVTGWTIAKCQEKCDNYSDPDIPGRQCLSVQMHTYDVGHWNRYMSECVLLIKVAEWNEDWFFKTQDPNYLVCKRTNQQATTTKPPRSNPNNEKCVKDCKDALADIKSTYPVVESNLAANMCNMMCDVKDAAECWPKARDMLARHQRAGEEPRWCEFADHKESNKPKWWNCKEKCVDLLHANRKDTGNYYPGEAEEKNACAGWCWLKPEDCYTQSRYYVFGKDALYNYNVNPVWCDIAEERKSRNLLSSSLLI